MEAKQLARLVSDMRSAQKEFFRTRSDAALEKSKQLERRARLTARAAAMDLGQWPRSIVCEANAAHEAPPRSFFRR